MKRAKLTDNRSGFTMVEMVVVLMVMSILLGATVWGVTGWIRHFNQVRNEETARYIYLGAQSCLSAHESRGTLDETMVEIAMQAGRSQGAVVTEETRRIFHAEDADKGVYGVPDEPDLHEREHLYVTLRADRNLLRASGDGYEENALLYSIIGPYLSDVETLDGSVSVEFDVTAGKVYSVFYSNWAAGFRYGAGDEDTSERGLYVINNGSREEVRREDFCVGYYASDQINVARLEASAEEFDVKAGLFNDETLHLDFRSGLENLEFYTEYTVDFYRKGDQSSADEGNDSTDTGEKNDAKKTDARKGYVKAFSVRLRPSDLAEGDPDRLKRDAADIEPFIKRLEVMDAKGNPMGKYPFYVGYRSSMMPDVGTPDREKEAHRVKDITLLLDQQMDSLSLAQMEDQDKKGTADADSLSITRFLGDEATLIYARVNVCVSSNAGGVLSGSADVDSNIENDLFATDRTLDGIGVGSETLLEGAYSISNNRHLYNIRFAENRKKREDSERGRQYTYTLRNDIYFGKAEIYQVRSTDYAKASEDKKVFTTLPFLSENSVLDGNGCSFCDMRLGNGSYVEYPRDAEGRLKTGTEVTNEAAQIGMIAENRGLIRRLVLRGAGGEILTAAQAGAKGMADDDGFPICSDNLHAVGILTGRDFGSMREIYLDDDCRLKASFFPMETPDPKQGCGVGLLAGTLYLTGRDTDEAQDVQQHDRLRTGGQVSATRGSGIGGDGDADSDCGIGGVFGYVYGDFASLTEYGRQPFIGAGESSEGVLSDLADGGDIFHNLTGAIENRAGVNEDTIAGSEPVGGILGNIQVKYPQDEALEQDGDGDATIPAGYPACVIGCRNLGSVNGENLVGGIAGVNGRGAFIEDCISYSDVKATKGVCAGITAENYGYLKNCGVDRAAGDELRPQGYAPQIEGCEEAEGIITGVNHITGVVMDCFTATAADEMLGASGGESTAKEKCVTLAGSEAKILGFIAGVNEGVIDGGIIGAYTDWKAGRNDLIIGGVAGVNRADAVIKHIESSLDLDVGRAGAVGGVVGENNGRITTCIFSGRIEQTAAGAGAAGVNYGGIAAINRKESDTATPPLIKNCYLVGSEIIGLGEGSFAAGDSEEQMILKTSSVGGVCGFNENGAGIKDCYATAHYEIDENGSALITEAGMKIDRCARLEVADGNAGGITGLNRGSLVHCGYSDKIILLQSDLDRVSDDPAAFAMLKQNGVITSVEGRSLTSALCQKQLSDEQDGNMTFFDRAVHFMEIATPGDDDEGEIFTNDPDSITGHSAWQEDRNELERTWVTAELNRYLGQEDTKGQRYREITALASRALRSYLMSDETGSLNREAKELCGDLQDEDLSVSYGDAADTVNALPKMTTSGSGQYGIDPFTAAYSEGQNAYIISSGNGTGNVGGITGYNSAEGSVEYCCSGKWLVETYHPQAQYTGTGGIAGRNTTGETFRYNMNFAYVRRELPQISGSPSFSKEDREFHQHQYVGGIIGLQSNHTSDSWKIEGCANVGKVVNLFGNDAAGVIGQWSENGGQVEECYNFGVLVTGYADTDSTSAGSGGGAGGVVGHMAVLNLTEPADISGCQNYGVVNLPMRGYSRSRQAPTNPNVVYAADNAGGIVGAVSAGGLDQSSVVRIEDCLNGENAEVYGHSCAGGIVGYAEGLRSSGQSDTDRSDSTGLSILSSRNYSSSLYTFTGSYEEASQNASHHGNADHTAGILAGVSPTGQVVGCISAENNLSLRLQGFDRVDDSCKILRCGDAAHADGEAPALSGFNFFVDEKSFQYVDHDGDQGYQDPAYFPQLSLLSEDRKKQDAQIAGSQLQAGSAVPKTEVTREDKDLDAYSYIGQEADRMVNANRLFAVTVADQDPLGRLFRTDSHILTWEQDGQQAATLDETNAYPGEDDNGNAVVIQRIGQEKDTSYLHVFGPVIYSFTENAPEEGREYTDDLVEHRVFRRLLLQNGHSGSRLPFSDEFDMDLYELDRQYLRFVDGLASDLSSPDKVIHVNVAEGETIGSYQATWDVVSEKYGPELVSADSFDVRITYYALDEEFDLSHFNSGLYDDDAVGKIVEETTVNTGEITFTPPEGLDLTGGRHYYAVVQVRDSRGEEDDFSEVTQGEYTGYVSLRKKLSRPEFEILEYEGRWVLHLLNPEDFAAYIEAGEDFIIKAYRLDKPEDEVVINGQELTLDTDSVELTNYVDCTGVFGTEIGDMVLGAVAEAPDALPSDEQTVAVYVPETTDPAIDDNRTQDDSFDMTEDTLEDELTR